jgi:DNA-binding IclR family transcriptional regulator
VYGRDGRVVCGVNLTSHTTRMSASQMVEEFLPLLQEIAEQLSQDLRHAYL